MTDTKNNQNKHSIHSGSDEEHYDNYQAQLGQTSSLPIPIPLSKHQISDMVLRGSQGVHPLIPKPPLPPLQKLGTRRLQINPSYFKAVPDPKEYKYYFAPDLKSKQ